MGKAMSARKDGFTLVELLIAIVIAAILAGMMLLTTGAVTDGAEASKLVGSLRSVKSAALFLHIDNNMTWLDDGDEGEALVKSLSQYTDRSIDGVKYNPHVKSVGGRLYIGFNGGTIWGDKPGIEKKLASMAKNAGLYNGLGKKYASGRQVYMNLK